MVRRIRPGDLDLAVACPLCKAQPGRPCKNLGQGGDLGGVVHRERRRAAEAGPDCSTLEAASYYSRPDGACQACGKVHDGV